MKKRHDLPVGTKAFLFSKLYYGVLTRRLDKLEIDRYYAVIFYVRDNSGCTQQQICNSLAIDKSGMVKVMSYLIKSGYIVKEVNPKDRREHFIDLTPLGRKRAIEITAAFRKLDDQLFKGIPDEDQEMFVQLIDKFITRLSSMPLNNIFFNMNNYRQGKAE